MSTFKEEKIDVAGVLEHELSVDKCATSDQLYSIIGLRYNTDHAKYITSRNLNLLYRFDMRYSNKMNTR